MFQTYLFFNGGFLPNGKIQDCGLVGCAACIDGAYCDRGGSSFIQLFVVIAVLFFAVEVLFASGANGIVRIFRWWPFRVHAIRLVWAGSGERSRGAFRPVGLLEPEGGRSGHGNGRSRICDLRLGGSFLDSRPGPGSGQAERVRVCPVRLCSDSFRHHPFRACPGSVFVRE